MLSTDYADVNNQYDCKDTCYSDPPYEMSKDLYINSFVNCEEMAIRLLNIKGKIILSLNDSERLRSTFKEFNIKSINRNSHSNTSRGNNRRNGFLMMHF